MNTTEITRVERVPVPPELLGFSIELPVPDTSSESYSFEFGGWALGATAPAAMIELVGNDGSVRTVPVIHPRADVGQAYPSMPEGAKVGFRASVSDVGMTPEFELLIQVRLQNEQRITIGRIFGRHRRIASPFNPMIQPLLVNSLGRMGTTWIMRLLSEHPAITMLARGCKQ